MILDKIPLEYKEKVIEILRIPEIKEALENDDFDLLYKLLSKIPGKKFVDLTEVYDKAVPARYYGNNYIIDIGGKEITLGGNNAGTGPIPSEIKSLVIKIITIMIDEAGKFKAGKSLAPNLFKGDKELTVYSIHPDVEVVPSKCFEECINLRSVDLGNVKVIGDQAFRDCESLEEIVFPETVEKIFGYSFAGCDSLKKITILNPKVKIGDSAFYGCRAVEEIVTANPKLVTDDKMFDIFGENCLGYEGILDGSLVASPRHKVRITRI